MDINKLVLTDEEMLSEIRCITLPPEPNFHLAMGDDGYD